MPIELYERDVLRQIGEAVGKVLRIDTHTAMEARGKYARLCVQVDTSKPLTNTVVIGHFDQPVMYEGIHSLCFSCGRVGHRKDDCPFIIRKDKEVLVPPDSTEEGPVKNSRRMHDSNSTNTSSKETKDSGIEEEGLYGPWMVVSRKRNGYNATNKGTNPEVITGTGWRPTCSHSFEGPSHVTKQNSGSSINSAGPKVTMLHPMLGQ